jgi:hypothetical protein
MSKVTFEVEISDMPDDKIAASGIVNTIEEAIKNVSFSYSENGENTEIKNVTVLDFVKTADDFDIAPHLKEIGSFMVEEVDYAIAQWGYDIGNKFGIDECCDWNKITKTLEALTLDEIKIVLTFVKESTSAWYTIVSSVTEHLVEHFDTDEAENELYGHLEKLEEDK